MDKKAVSCVMLTLLLTSVLMLALGIQPVRASRTIYIRPDGSVWGTDKIQQDRDVYTFTDNIYDEIVVERDNVVLDGAGYTLQGTVSLYTKGIDLVGRRNVTLTKTSIEGFYYGIYLNSCSNNSIFGNKMTKNEYGIRLDSSQKNSISRNKITSNEGGVFLFSSSDNCVFENNITRNRGEGIYLPLSFDNSIYENNVTGNKEGIILADSSTINVSRNNIAANEVGIVIASSSTNVILENDLATNEYGIYLIDGSSNHIYHNNFLSNTYQAYDFSRSPFSPPGMKPSICSWNGSYPSGGNYWSDYTDEDLHNGPNQDINGGDGIWDHPYEIDAGNTDNYPLVNPWIPLPRTINKLKMKVEEFGLEGRIDNKGIVKSLVAKLNAAQRLVDQGKVDEAKPVLEGLITQVRGLLGIHIAREVGELLIKSAEYIMSNL